MCRRKEIAIVHQQAQPVGNVIRVKLLLIPGDNLWRDGCQALLEIIVNGIREGRLCEGSSSRRRGIE